MFLKFVINYHCLIRLLNLQCQHLELLVGANSYTVESFIVQIRWLKKSFSFFLSLFSFHVTVDIQNKFLVV